MAFMKRDFWQLGRSRRPTATTTTTVVPPEFVIMSLAGHKPSGLADAFGGYLCACRKSSWSHLTTFGPHGGCAQGWFDAREFLSRYGVRDGAE